MHSGHKLITAFLIVFMALGASSCRTSQQSRRNTAANSRANAAGGGGKSMDSLYMVQDKLLTIIDTMSNILLQDQNRIRDLEIEVAKLRSLLDQQRISGGVPAPALAPLPSIQNYTAPPSAPPVSQPSSSQPSSQPQISSWQPNDKYSAGLKSFNDGRYMDALTAFDELARTDVSSPYAPNFLYWKGESLYALGQYAEAIRTFHDVLTKYPSSTKADDAEFKIGASYEKLGDKNNARSAYDRLILSFPDSEYKPRAAARLSKLR